MRDCYTQCVGASSAAGFAFNWIWASVDGNVIAGLS